MTNYKRGWDRSIDDGRGAMSHHGIPVQRRRIFAANAALLGDTLTRDGQRAVDMFGAGFSFVHGDWRLAFK